MSDLTLSTDQLTKAAFNSAVDEFTLGERTFTIYQLPYDDYCAFMTHIAPLMENICKRIILSKNGGVELPGGITIEAASFSVFDLLKICSHTLPEMAQLVCKQSDPTITLDDVKKLAGKPIALAEPVLKQIMVNGMIQDFKDFFAQMISMLKAFK